MSIDNKFGKALRTIREDKNITQTELAKQIGIAPSHLNKIENGVRMPSKKVINKLVEILDQPNLFIAAGRLIPKEFENPVKQNRLLLKNLPDFLKNIEGYYFTQFIQATDKEKKLEDDIRTIEKIISSNVDCYISLSSEYLNEKLEISDLLRSLNYELARNFWNLQILAWEKGTALGKNSAVKEIYDEIKTFANQNLVEFLMDFTGLNFNDAEIIADFIQLRSKNS